MTTLDVALRLRLINQLKGEAGKVARDLAGIKTAAKGLDSSKGPDKLKRDILEVSTASRRASRGLSDVKREASGLASTRGPERLKRDLLETASAARQAERALAGTRNAAKEARDARTRDKSTPPAGQHRPPGEAGGGPSAMLLAGSRRMIPAIGGAYLGYRTVRSGVSSVVEQDTAWADVRKKVNGTKEQMEALQRELREMAIKYGMSIPDAFSQAAEAGAAGINIKEVPEAVRIAMMGSVAWDTSPRETMKHMMQTRAAMNWTMAQTKDWADKVNAIADASEVAERDLIETSKRSFAAGAAAGVDPDTVMAVTGGQMAGGMQDEIAARWFNTFSSRLAGAHAGTKKQKEALKKYLGIDPNELADGMEKDARGTMLNFLRKFQGLQQKDKIAFGTNFFGAEWWDETVRATNVIEKIGKMLGILDDKSKWSGSMDQNLAIKMSTIAAHWERIKAAASEVANDIARATGATEAFNNASEKLVDWYQQQKKRETEGTTPEQRKEMGLLDRRIDGAREAVRRREQELRETAETPKSKYPGRFQSGAYAQAQRRAKDPGSDAELQKLRFRLRVLENQREGLNPRPPAGPPILRGPATPVPQKGGATPVRNYTPIRLPVDQIAPRGAEGQVQATMQGITRAITTEGEKAVAETRSIAERIKALLNSLNMNVSPTITPRFGGISGAPGGGGGAGGAQPQSGPAPAGGGPPVRKASRGSVVISGPLHFHGVQDVAALHRKLTNLTDRAVVDSRDGALHDTWSYST